MALSKNVKGLVIELSADTKGVAQALRDVEKNATKLSRELTDVQKLLRYDNTSVVALTQKKELLTKAVAACADKLEILRETEQRYQALDPAEKTEEMEAKHRALAREIEATEIKMRDYQKSLDGTYQSLSKLGVTTDDVRYAVARMAEATDTADEPIDRIGDHVRELDARYETLTRQLKDVNAVLKQSPGNVSALAQKKELLAKAVATATERLEALQRAQQHAKQQFEIGAISDEQFNDIRIATSRAEAELEELSSELRKLGTTGAAHMDELEEETEEAGRAAENAKGGYTVFKDILADICADVLREFVELMKEASKYILLTGMDFEASMSKVEALLGPTEATGEAMSKLTKLAMDMGAKTKFSAGESAEAMTYLAQAGWDTEQIMAGLPGVMALAATDGIDLASAAEICSDALNSLGYKAGDAATFADALAVVAAASSTNVEELGYAFQYVGPVAGALGYSIDDLSVALGLMANAGLKGEKAGTSLRSLFTNLSKPTDAMAAAMEQYGISLTDASGKMLPFADVMAQLRGVFAGLTEEQQASLAATLAGKTGMAGLLAIVNAAPEDFYAMMEAIDESNGAAQEMADTMQDNLAGDVEKLGGAFETLSIKIFNGFSEPLREATQALTGFLEGSVSLPELLESIGNALSDMAASFAEFLPTLSEVGSQLLQFLIDGITNGLPTLLDKMNEMVLSIGQYLTEMAPTFLQFGIDLIMNLAQGIADFIPNLITIGADIIGSLAGGIQQSTADFISNALTILDGFADKLGEAIPVLIEKGAEFLLNMAKGISQALPEFIARAPEIISKFANLINDNFPTILMKGVEIIWELIKGIIKAIPTLIANIPKIIMAIVDTIMAFNWLNLGKNIIDGFGKGIKGMWNWLKDIGKKTGEAVSNGLKGLGSKMATLGKNAASSLGNALKNGWTVVKNGATNLLNAAKSGLSKLGSALSTIGKKAASGLGSALSKGWSAVKAGASKLHDGINSIMSKSPAELLQIGKDMVSKLGSALRNGWGVVKEGAAKIRSSLVEFMSKSPAEMLQIGKDIITGLWDGLWSKINWLKDKVCSIGSSIVGWFKDILDIHSPSRVARDEIGKMFGLGLAEGIVNSVADVQKASEQLNKAAMGGLDISGFALENNLRQRGVQMAAEVTARADNTMLGKLDKIVSAIERGQILTIDGKALVGSTAQMYDNRLGQRRALVARGAI